MAALTRWGRVGVGVKPLAPPSGCRRLTQNRTPFPVSLSLVSALPSFSSASSKVIDEAMMEHRMSEQRRLHPNDGDFYIMELGHSLFVDAKEKGNLTRLINHR